MQYILSSALYSIAYLYIIETIFVLFKPDLMHIYNKLLNQIKATLSVYKLITKNAQMTTLYTNWSFYVTFTMICYIRQE